MSPGLELSEQAVAFFCLNSIMLSISLFTWWTGSGSGVGNHVPRRSDCLRMPAGPPGESGTPETGRIHVIIQKQRVPLHTHLQIRQIVSSGACTAEDAPPGCGCTM